MRAEDLVVDERGEGEVVEHVGDVPPHIRVPVLPQAQGLTAGGGIIIIMPTSPRVIRCEI